MPPTDPARRDDAPWTEEDEHVRLAREHGLDVERIPPEEMTEEDRLDEERALRDLAEGRTVPHDEVMRQAFEIIEQARWRRG